MTKTKKDPVIEVRDLVKRYRQAKENAVNGVSFDVQGGEFFTLLGPNGAGKTTTISILTTTLAKTAGSLKVAGYDVDTQSSQVRRQVGIIFQKPSLDQNLTAEENVRFHTVLYGMYPFRPSFAMMPKEYQQRVWQLAELLGIKKALNKQIKEFSGGMKRKLEIIRSLMHDPQVLFLDEPTTGLDPESRRNLWQYLQQVRKDKKTTIFLTTHYLDEAEDADRVCIIHHGRIVALGTTTEIKQKLVKEYVTMDADKRKNLRKELDQAKLSYTGEGPFRIVIDGHSAQEVVQTVSTKLSRLSIHAPTLEEAYLEVVRENTETKENL